jgi:anti-anti-sigma factor
MTVETRVTNDNTVLIIGVIGKFDFKLLNEFRQAYSNDTADFVKVVIDMRQTSTIDSSALGMLLNMQRYLKKTDTEINIINCNPDVTKIFNITHFDKKFIIE